MASLSSRPPGRWRSYLFPECPLPPERQRYFDTFLRLYLIAITTYAVVLLPMFWLLQDTRLLVITLIGLVTSLGARELHRRGFMTGGVCLLLAAMAWHMLEAVRVFGGGIGFELYFPLILMIIYISAMAPSIKLTACLSVLILTALQLIALKGETPSWPYSALARDLLLVTNLVVVSVLFAVILGGLEGVTERIERDCRREASCDALTGIHNRRAVTRVAERAIRDQRPFALLLLDVDHFKQINDHHGHELGDRALCHLVQCLNQGLRDQDVLGRYGGEEFLVIMHDMTLDEAVAVAERLLTLVRERPYAVTAQALHMAVSIGVAVSSQAMTLECLIALADRRLYAAKRAGRGRVVAVDMAPDPTAMAAPSSHYG